MDTEIQNQQMPNVINAQGSSSKISTTHHLVYGLISLLILVIGVGAVYMWQHNKVTALNKQLADDHAALVKDANISLDNLTALHALPNVVEDSANSPADLLAFLGSDNTGCYKGNGGSGYYKVLAQTNDQFAKMQYGCTAKDSSTPLGSSPTYILAEKVNHKWALISPTNQWLPINGQDLPSCTMINTNKVSKLITPLCWNGPAITSSGTFNLKNYSAAPVTNP